MSPDPNTPGPAPPVHAPQPPVPVAPTHVPAGTEPATDTGIPASAHGWLAEGGFSARLGSGLRLSAELLANRELDPTRIPQPLPGVRITALKVRGRQVLLDGTLQVPYVEDNEVHIRLDRDGSAQVTGRARAQLQVPALGNPRVDFALDEGGALSVAVEFSALDLSPRRTRMEITGSGRLLLSNGRFTGQLHADFAYPQAGSAAIDVGFDEAGQFTGAGTLELTPPFLDALGATITADSVGNLAAEATLDAAGQHSPLPGLEVGTGQILIGYQNGVPSASLTGFSASYSGVGSLTITTLELSGPRPTFGGEGELLLTIPGLEEVKGSVRVRESAVSGSLSLSARDFPEGLPLENGTLTIILSEAGQLGFRGGVGVALEPAARGRLEASYDQGRFALSTRLELTIPGMAPVQVTVAYTDGAISGEVDVPIDSELVPGLSGAVHVEYAQDRWSGETTLAYSADDGKLSGTVTVTVTQTEENSLEVGGSGSVTAQLLPNLAGTLTATILPEGGVDVSGTIEVTEPVELFPEKRLEKELFSHSQNIPLWAILVAVIRIRAGVRAGIGPGVFRNITVTGSYTIGATEADPSFTVSGELFIPAFVEGYLAFGAGLGLDVVLGSLTGGIEAMGTAGIYGAISVIPELSYQAGEWSIAGVATLAAGARLKLSLNAWAEVEAFWVTVWDDTWELASVTMPIGPDLALQARMNYVFGRPEPPELEFSSTDIDSESLIQSAMPEDGPAPSGAREALENRAEWQGALREQRTAPVPAELAEQAGHSEPAPQPAARPPASSGPPPGAARTDAPGLVGEPTTDSGTPGAATQGAAASAAAPDDTLPAPVPENQLPATDEPRFTGPVSLQMLDEPPVPVPRTKEQEHEDVAAASRAVDLASAQASSSDTLDDYFPRIKNRFRLSALGYEGDFDTGFKVAGSINPGFDNPLEGEPLQGPAIGVASGPAHKTEVEYRKTSLEGTDVGIEMKASPLGPDHKLGSAPQGQASLMEKLSSEYIRGHLLNEHLGGPGEPRNLFPITRSANALHSSRIEETIKRWVNTDRYWVRYHVKIVGPNRIETDASDQDYINSTIKAQAWVLDTNLAPWRKVETEITSHYGLKSSATAQSQNEASIAGVTGHQARSEDLAITVQVSGSGYTSFPDKVRADLGHMLLAAEGDVSRVCSRLKKAENVGVGAATARVLMEAYALPRGPSDQQVLLSNAVDKRLLTIAVGNWDAIMAQMG